MMSFHYVIVGAGSAGCTLAHRLTEDPEARVLLLEAGPADDADAIRVPALFGTLFGSDVDWGYELDPQPSYQGSAYFPRGRTLGGSSAINLMIYIRGSREDFDGWAAGGATGWDFDSVLPYFVRAERNSRFTGPPHGTAGPLHVEDRMFTHELSKAWTEAAADWGLDPTEDFNGASQLGSGRYQVTCRRGVRRSAADAYLRPALDRPGLTVRTDAEATRVLVEGGRAVGVEFRADGAVHTVRAEREVLLSGGVVNSPKLLMLSGVGPGGHLRDLGIGVVADLPGVGENLHDHVMVPLVWATRGSTDLLELASPQNMERWRRGLGGPFASNGAEVGGFLSVTGGGTADVQFMGGPTAFVDHGRFSLPLPNFSMQTAVTRPAARGRLRLRSADPSAPPHLDPGYFTERSDLDMTVAGLRASLEIAAREPFARYVKGLALPAGATDTEALRAHARRRGQSSYHGVGTCAIGAVVDPCLRVHGVAGLRVVDASVMPAIPSGNINAATIMIAERAADLLKAGPR
ncbi:MULTISPECIES: GMC family oxidoreductase N-terminal domain-containing protein [unclassified Streptomyces]|uniref:GMC family oxidoreductase n=1 Tax=unclassified Streptomyces TaxID=2593676 RepID=UPI00331F3C60